MHLLTLRSSFSSAQLVERPFRVWIALSTDFRPKLKSQYATFVKAALRKKKKNFLEVFLMLWIFFHGQISKFQTKLDVYSLWIRRSYNTQTRLIASHWLINFYKGPSTKMLSSMPSYSHITCMFLPSLVSDTFLPEKEILQANNGFIDRALDMYGGKK